jgi:hypothetical protein
MAASKNLVKASVKFPTEDVIGATVATCVVTFGAGDTVSSKKGAGCLSFAKDTGTGVYLLSFPTCDGASVFVQDDPTTLSMFRIAAPDAAAGTCAVSCFTLSEVADTLTATAAAPATSSKITLLVLMYDN